MELFLIRHGQSEGNIAGPKAGALNPGLTDLGLKQAAFAGERVAENPPNALYCGPLRRNLQTAEQIYKASGVHPVLLPPLFEIGGNKRAWSVKKVNKYFPMVRTKLKLPAGQQDSLETWSAALDRARRIVLWVREQYEALPGARVCLIGHGRFNQVLLELCLGLQTRRDAWLSCGNCAFHWVELLPGSAKAVRLNDDSHIPPNFRS
ncbi:MAG TPA: histidine phosphatase family protein [Candidatus Hydrogenedentes bacterium]|nr:histidine phosphatase family protein [Candidatus Hydrogenedentota bacterium]